LSYAVLKKKKKKSGQLLFFRVNPVNSMHSCCALFCAALLHVWVMSEIPPPAPAPGPPPASQNDSKSASVSEPMPQHLDYPFELLLTLVYPSKRVHTSNRKTKNMKPESENKGPYEVTTNIGWDAFLGFIADKLMVGSSSLVVASFEWHWLKPASGP